MATQANRSFNPAGTCPQRSVNEQSGLQNNVKLINIFFY